MKYPFRRACVAGLALSSLVMLVSCYTVPGTGRSSLNLISSQEESHLGEATFLEIRKKEKESTHPESIALVQKVGGRIAAIADPDIQNAKWEFVVFENKEPNAFALPGGKVGVHSGILEITKDEAGLAAVLGHEIGHVSARHGAERMSQQLVTGAAAVGLSTGLRKKDEKTRQYALLAFGLGSTFGYLLPYSRLQESEADRIGLMYMAKAGYDPKQAIEFWIRFRDYHRKKGGSPPSFLSTHPADEKRIEDLKTFLPEAELYYQTSGKRVE